MALNCTCPQCGAAFQLNDDLAGKSLRCAKCEATFTAPAASNDPGAAIQVTPVPPRPASATPPEPPRSRPRPRRDRAEQSSGGTPIALILGGVALLGVLLMSCFVGVGVMFWFSFRAGERDRVAMKPMPEPFFVDEVAVQDDVRIRPNMPIEEPPFGPPGAQGGPGPGPFPGPGPGIPGQGPGPGPGPGGGPPFKGPQVPPMPIDEGPELPPFQEAPNPFKPDSQVRLKELKKFKAPGNAAQMVFSPKHQLLFLRNSGGGVWVVDTKTEQALGLQTAAHQFSDIAIAPDQSAVFVADYGGTNIGYGTPSKPSYIHRYDLTTRKWERRTAPKVAYRIEVVDAWRFVLQEQDQWVNVMLNRWEQKEDRITELARQGGGYHGDIDYDPRTGRIYHGNSGSSSREIIVTRVAHNRLVSAGNTGTYGSADKGGGGGGATLSVDGSRFYYGCLQVEALDVRNNRNVFPEVIAAASRDLAFAKRSYYRANNAQKAGEFEFEPGAICVSRDSQFVWAFDQKAEMLHQYAIEGDR